MAETLLTVLKHSWPWLVGFYLGAEVLLYVNRRAGLRALLIAAGALVLTVTLLLQIFYPFTPVWPYDSIRFFIANFLGLLLPATAATGAIWVTSESKAAHAHLAVLGLVTGALLFWPLWLLFLMLGTGLDSL